MGGLSIMATGDILGYLLATLSGTGQGVEQLQQKDRQRALDARQARSSALDDEFRQSQIAAQQQKPTRRAVGTEKVLGPDGKPRLATRFEDGGLELSDMQPYEKPEAPRRVYSDLRGAVVDPETGTATPVKGLPPRQVAPSGGGGGRPMSPQSAEQFAQSVADKAVAAAGGDIQKAAQLATQDPMGREAYKRGLSTRHFQAAALAFKQDQQTFKKRMQGGGGDVEAAIAAALGGGDAAPAEPSAASQQQQDWDAAAAELRSQGKDPESVIGPRP